MKIRLQEGDARSGRRRKDPVREIEVDDGWAARNMLLFPPKNATVYVGAHMFEAIQRELAKLNRDQ